MYQPKNIFQLGLKSIQALITYQFLLEIQRWNTVNTIRYQQSFIKNTSQTLRTCFLLLKNVGSGCAIKTYSFCQDRTGENLYKGPTLAKYSARNSNGQSGRSSDYKKKKRRHAFQKMVTYVNRDLIMSVIEKWKSDDTVVRFLEGDDSYGIRVIDRGEHLFSRE